MCACTCVCSCKCTYSHTLTHACAHSPVLRKSKIAVSLNSFPLAARTAFVLQTKRKRNETEGSEEAGEGEREGARAKEQTEEEGNLKGEEEEGEAGGNRKTGWGARREAPLHPCSLKAPRSPRCHQSLITGRNSSSSPTKSYQRGAVEMGIKPGGRKLLPNKLAPSGDMPPAQGIATCTSAPAPSTNPCFGIKLSATSSRKPSPWSSVCSLSYRHRQMASHLIHGHSVSHTALSCVSPQRRLP